MLSLVKMMMGSASRRGLSFPTFAVKGEGIEMLLPGSNLLLSRRMGMSDLHLTVSSRGQFVAMETLRFVWKLTDCSIKPQSQSALNCVYLPAQQINGLEACQLHFTARTGWSESVVWSQCTEPCIRPSVSFVRAPWVWVSLRSDIALKSGVWVAQYLCGSLENVLRLCFWRCRAVDQRVALKYVANENAPHYFPLHSPNAPARGQEEKILLYHRPNNVGSLKPLTAYILISIFQSSTTCKSWVVNFILYETSYFIGYGLDARDSIHSRQEIFCLRHHAQTHASFHTGTYLTSNWCETDGTWIFALVLRRPTTCEILSPIRWSTFEECMQYFCLKTWGNNPLQDRSVDGRLILKWILSLCGVAGFISE